MIFNGIEKDYIRVDRELFRPPTPPIEFYTTPRYWGGERVRWKRLGALELPVPITIRSNRRIEELKGDMSNWLVHDKPKQLVFKDTPNCYYLALYQGMELSEYYRYAKGLITFYLPEGYRFGKEINLNIPTTYNTYTITGQTNTPWTSRTTFTTDAESYTLETQSGGKIILNYNFIEGDVLEIDYDKRDVNLNGEDLAVSVALETVWFELEPGEVAIKASHETEMKYTERYY